MKQKNTPSLKQFLGSKSLVRKGQRVTSYDVAEQAGVSQSTVTRSFKPDSTVSKKIRNRVMAVAKKLGYQPNAIARSLITRRSNLVGVILSDFTNLHHPEILFELNQAFSKHGIHVLLFTLLHEGDIDEIIGQVIQYQVDGVVVATTLSSKEIDYFEKRDIPIVSFNQNLQGRMVNSVCCDQVGGERMLVNALASIGHSSFGFISGPDDSMVSIQRTTGARDRLRELGFDNVPIVHGDYTYESGQIGARELLSGGAPDAIICANDVMAMGCIDILRKEYEMDIPKDISVVGFDGIAPALWIGYSLTTIRQPVRQMSEAAVEMIMNRVEEPDTQAEMRVFPGVMHDGNSARLS